MAQSNYNASRPSACQTHWSQSSNFRLQFWASKVLAPAPDQFGSKNRMKHCIICATRLPHKLFPWNRKPNSTPAPPSKKVLAQGRAMQNCFGSVSTALLRIVGSFILARVAGEFILSLKLFSKWELSIGLDFKSKNIQSDMNCF